MIKISQKTKVVTIVILAICILMGILIEQYSYVYQWEWVLIPWVRIIFHAVAAIVASMTLAWIGLPWATLAHDRMGDWISVIYFCSNIRRRGLLLKLRRINTNFFKYTQPFIGAILYIVYASDWEKYQAEYYQRNVQTGQLTVDIIFSIIGVIIWTIIFNSNMISGKYTLSPKECINDLKNDICCIEENKNLSPKQKKIFEKLIICMVLLIPIWIAFSVIVILWIIQTIVERGVWIWC